MSNIRGISERNPIRNQIAQQIIQNVPITINSVMCFASQPTTYDNVIEGGGNSTNSTPLEPKTQQEKEDAIINLIGNNIYNQLTTSQKEDVMKKYECFVNVLNLNEEELTRRLTNYVEALQARQKVVEINDHLTQACGTVENDIGNCSITIQDEDIAQQKLTGTDAEYLNSLHERGEGYVDLYDTNGDNMVDLQEFLALEEKDSGQKLSEDIIAMNQVVFDRLDKNDDNFIDSKEMASHLYAVSRLFDGSSNTVEEISFKEIYGSQMVDTDANIKKNYDYASDQLYGAL